MVHDFICNINACIPVPERMFSSVVILNIVTYIWATIPFDDEKSLLAFNTPSQNDITIHQSNHFSKTRSSKYLSLTDDSRKFSCKQNLQSRYILTAS